MLFNNAVIVFEGLDGSGKDTQIELFSNYLIRRKVEHVVINSLSSPTIAPIIRDMLKDNEVDNKQMACLFLAELHEVFKMVKKALREDKVVILNRWYLSTIAYNASNLIEKTAIEDLAPKLHNPYIVYIDVPPNICMERINKRNKEKDKYENSRFLSFVYNNYGSIMHRQNIITIDGAGNESEVHKRILDRLGLEFV